MHRNIRRAAIVFWLLSLVLPTLRMPSGELVLGYQLVWQAISVIAAFVPLVFFAPIAIALVMCLLTNLLFLRELASLTSRAEYRWSSPKPWCVILALALNVVAPTRFAQMPDPPPLGLPGLVTLPGYYSWLAALVLLLVASLVDRPHILEVAPGVLKRLVLLAGITVASALLFGVLALTLR